MAAVVGNKLDTVLTGKAVAALFKFEEKKLAEKGKQKLIGEYASPILAQVQLKNMIKKPVVRPVRVKIPHSLFSVEGEDHSVCLFCRSDDKKAIEEYLSEHKVAGLDKVLSVNDVRKLYSAYKDKKRLLGEHTHFVCDTNIFSQLHNLLGKTFNDRNDCPVPITFKAPKDIEDAVNKVTSSSYMHLKGKTLTIRFGHSAMTVAQVASNVVEGLQFAVPKLVNGWKDIHSIHLKTPSSPALPIFSKVPSEAMEFMKEQVSSETGSKGAAGAKGKVAKVEKVSKAKAGAKEQPPADAPASKAAGATKGSKGSKGPSTSSSVASVEVSVETAKSTVTGGKAAKAKAAAKAAPAEPAPAAAAAPVAGSKRLRSGSQDAPEVAAPKPVAKKIKAAVVKVGKKA